MPAHTHTPSSAVFGTATTQSCLLSALSQPLIDCFVWAYWSLTNVNMGLFMLLTRVEVFAWFSYVASTFVMEIECILLVCASLGESILADVEDV